MNGNPDQILADVAFGSIVSTRAEFQAREPHRSRLTTYVTGSIPLICVTKSNDSMLALAVFDAPAFSAMTSSRCGDQRVLMTNISITLQLRPSAACWSCSRKDA